MPLGAAPGLALEWSLQMFCSYWSRDAYGARQQLDIIFFLFSFSFLRTGFTQISWYQSQPIYINKWVTYAYIILFFLYLYQADKDGGYPRCIPMSCQMITRPYVSLSDSTVKVSWHLPLIPEHLLGFVRSMLELRTFRSVETPTA